MSGIMNYEYQVHLSSMTLNGSYLKLFDMIKDEVFAFFVVLYLHFIEQVSRVINPVVGQYPVVGHK